MSTRVRSSIHGIFTKGCNFCNLSLLSLMKKPFQKGHLLKKNIAPRVANSFLLELTPLASEAKMKMHDCSSSLEVSELSELSEFKFFSKLWHL